MRKVYYKDGEQVAKPRVVAINGMQCYSPSDAQIQAAGYEIREIIDPVPEPPTKEQQYKWRVVELIRERYDMDDEYALLRQRDTKVAEFAAYNTYCEACKAQAHQEIYGDE